MKKDGIVYVEGVMKTGTLNTAAFTLPVGFRPSGTLNFTQMANGAFARLAIGSTGAVNPVSGSNVWFAICVSFVAEL
jgi:hypothetical protein